MQKNASGESNIESRYPLIFDKEAFQAMRKGHRRRLYLDMHTRIKPPMSVVTYKGWFLYPETLLQFKDERRDYLLKAMSQSLVETLKEIVEEMDALQSEIDEYRPLYQKALAAYQKTQQD